LIVCCDIDGKNFERFYEACKIYCVLFSKKQAKNNFFKLNFIFDEIDFPFSKGTKNKQFIVEAVKRELISNFQTKRIIYINLMYQKLTYQNFCIIFNSSNYLQ
ncbi:hypothetical protein RFI_08372, partial [Reticulomyxa filosa]